MSILDVFRKSPSWPTTSEGCDGQIAKLSKELAGHTDAHRRLAIDDAASPLDSKGRKQLDDLAHEIARTTRRIEALREEREHLAQAEQQRERDLRIAAARSTAARCQAAFADLQKSVEQVAREADAALKVAHEFTTALSGLEPHDFDRFGIEALGRRIALALFAATENEALRPNGCPQTGFALKELGWASVADFCHEWLVIGTRHLESQSAPEAEPAPVEETANGQSA